MKTIFAYIAAGGAIAVLFALILGVILGISFLCTAGLVWLVCWGLASAGIGAVSFSWGLAFAVWIIMALLRSVFSRRVTVTTD